MARAIIIANNHSRATSSARDESRANIIGVCKATRIEKRGRARFCSLRQKSTFHFPSIREQIYFTVDKFHLIRERHFVRRVLIACTHVFHNLLAHL